MPLLRRYFLGASSSREGLPLALQIASRPFGESTVFEVGYAYQQAAGWHQHHPDLEKTLNAA